MDNLNEDSSIRITRAREFPICIESSTVMPCPKPLVAPNNHNTLESTTISMDNTSEGDGEIAITIKDANEYAPPSQPPPFPTTDTSPKQFHIYQGILYLVYAGAVVVMYPSLTQLAQLKFQNNKHSPFETHTFFTNTAVVAYTTAISTSIVLFYMNARTGSSNKERFSPLFYTILKSVFYFSSILAPLSLVLVLLIPREFNWFGYSTMFVLFVIIVVCTITDHRSKKDISRFKKAQKDVKTLPLPITISDQ